MFYCITEYQANCEIACKNVADVWSDVFSTADIFNSNILLELILADHWILFQVMLS